MNEPRERLIRGSECFIPQTVPGEVVALRQQIEAERIPCSGKRRGPMASGGDSAPAEIAGSTESDAGKFPRRRIPVD